MAKNKVYAVAKGRRTGLFYSWAETEKYIKGFPGAIYKGFSSEKGALQFLRENNAYIIDTLESQSEYEEVSIPQKKLYAVAKGRSIGIFNDWDGVKKSVSGYSGALFKSFTSESDAKVYLEANSNLGNKSKQGKVSNNMQKGNEFAKLYINNEVEEDTRALNEIVNDLNEYKSKKEKIKKKYNKNITVAEILDDNGPFSKLYSFYKKRESQVEAATMIENVLKEKNHFLFEGPCGIGKSVAYLLSSIKNMVENGEGKIVVVTSNISLQEQLIFKDIPMIIEVFKNVYGEEVEDRINPAMLKGISNFICKSKYEESIEEGKIESNYYIEKINEFIKNDESGDLGEVDFNIPPAVNKLITTTSDECKGKDCPNKHICYSARHKDIARRSNVLVTNYHMLFSSYPVGSSVFLGTDVMVFDEVHEAEHILREFEATSISSSGVYYIEKKLSEIKNTDKEGVITDLLNKFNMQSLKDSSQYYFNQLMYMYGNKLEDSCKVIEAQVELPDAENFNMLLQRLSGILDQTLKTTTQNTHEVESVGKDNEKAANIFIESKKDNTSQIKKKIKSLKKSCEKISYMISSVDEILENKNKVLWVEKENTVVRIGLKDIDVSNTFKSYFLESNDLSCILTSATISVNNSFEYIKSNLGVGNIENPNKKTIEYIGKSPFDLENQELWYIPKNAVAGNSPNFDEEIIGQISEVVDAVNGGTLCLFTSMSNLNNCKVKLPNKLPGMNFLAQGDKSRRMILEEFKRDENSCLLATKSFFTGVDVSGNSLRCVVVDKLPFASPTDPVQQKLRQRSNSFAKHMLPEMIITLRQGFGRGIRSIEDRCVLVLTDERVLSSTYSNAILSSFKYEKNITRDINDVEKFINNNKDIISNE